MVAGARGWIAGGAVVVAVAFVVGWATRPSRAIEPVAVERGLAVQAPRVSPPDAEVRGAGPASTGAVPSTEPTADLGALTRTRAYGVPVSELFEEEGRDARWADAVEAAASASYLRVLSVVAPWATTVTVDCRTSLCKVSLDVDQGQVQASMNRLQSVSIGAGVSPFADQGDDGRWRAGVYVLFDRDEREAAMQPRHWTDGVDARFPGGNPQLQSWLEESERREREESQQRAAGAGP